MFPVYVVDFNNLIRLIYDIENYVKKLEDKNKVSINNEDVFELKLQIEELEIVIKELKKENEFLREKLKKYEENLK